MHILGDMYPPGNHRANEPLSLSWQQAEQLWSLVSSVRMRTLARLATYNRLAAQERGERASALGRLCVTAQASGRQGWLANWATGAITGLQIG